MSFKECVEKASNPLRGAFREGKQALKREHRRLVECTNTRNIVGSVDVDSSVGVAEEHQHSKTWDYGVGYKDRGRQNRERAIWVEVHPAHTKNVSEVVEKLAWLKRFLRSEASALNEITYESKGIKPFVWIATGPVAIPRNSRQARMLSLSGLDMPRKILKLP